jgi:hypothetical protein
MYVSTVLGPPLYQRVILFCCSLTISVPLYALERNNATYVLIGISSFRELIQWKGYQSLYYPVLVTRK